MSEVPKSNPLYVKRKGIVFELISEAEIGPGGCAVVLDKNPALLRHQDGNELTISPLISAAGLGAEGGSYYIGDHKTRFPGNVRSAVVSGAEGIHVERVGPEGSFSLYFPLIPIAIAAVGNSGNHGD